MDRKEAADPVAGAVGIVDPGLPQRIARTGIELGSDRALRKHRQRQHDVALEHAGEAVLVLCGGLTRPDPDSAGDIGRPIKVLPARIDQVDRIGGDGQVGLFINPVMRAGGVRPRGGNRVERKIAEQVALVAESAQFRRSGEFCLSALGGLDAQPVQEFRNRRAVAGLGGALAGLLDRVLLRLGQYGRVGDLDHLGSGLAQRAEHSLDRPFRIDRNLLAGQRLQLRHEGFARAHCDGVAQVRSQFGRNLFLGDEQLGRAVGMGQHEGQCHGGALNIGSAQVEQPGHSVQCRDNRGIQALGAQPFGHLAALGLARLTGIFIAVNQRRSGRRRRLVGPDRVDRIVVYRYQRGAPWQKCPGCRFGPGLAVQPGIEPDLHSRSGILCQPGRHGRIQRGLVFEQTPIDLLAHLQRIATVNKDRRLVAQYRRGPGRSAEAGQPGQPLGVGTDIFAHMLVRDRDHEPIEAAGLQFLAQRFEARFVRIHQHGLQSF